MVRVKICGITNLEDALAAVEAGADALGFNFLAAAPEARRVTPEQAAAISERLPPFVACVGLVSRAEADAALASGMHALQVYGDAPAGPRAIRVFPVAEAADLAAIQPHAGRIAAALLDARVPGKLGGTGRTIPWELAAQAKRYGVPIILAGGLTPENVADAVRIARPYAVDVSSGVESAPGRKDAGKMKAFVAAAKGEGS